jgi:hypothetical protein
MVAPYIWRVQAFYVVAGKCSLTYCSGVNLVKDLA